MLRISIARLYSKTMFSLVRNCIFQSVCTIVHPQQHWKRTLLIYLLSSNFLDFSHSNRYVVVSYCLQCFQCQVILSIFSYAYLHLCIFFGEIFVQIFCCLFSSGLWVYLLLNFRSFMYFSFKNTFILKKEAWFSKYSHVLKK